MQRRYKILVIEDNEINRDILNDMLSDEYDMLFAEDGKEGITMLREHYKDIEIVLLDIMMPVMNGFEVLEAKAKDPLIADIPVIVTTNDDGRKSEIHCLKLGATDFIRKPYIPVIVRIRISNIIKLRKSTEANRQKTIFIQNISHELRTPMNAIIGFSQILNDEDMETDDETRKMYHDIINKSSHSMMDMIENMLTHSEIDSNTLSMKKDYVSVNKICRDSLNKATYCYPEGVKVYFTSDVTDALLVNTDAKLMTQALENFITNSAKFTTQGEIHMHCTDTLHHGYVSISVTDTGIGVGGKHFKDIFERFTKIDDFVPGVGLGLNLVKKIATILDCIVYLDTAYTTGARFVFEIPCEVIKE